MEKLVAGDPSRVGAYRLLARLGAGAMGQVFLGRSDRGRTAAVTLVHRGLAEQERFRGRFRQEVAAARRVSGTWTARVLDADTEAEVPWLATAYIAAPSLRSVVSGEPAGGGHGPLPEHTLRVLAAGLAHALDDLHAAEIVHRALRPSAVLMTAEGPRVIGFGAARALETVTGAGAYGPDALPAARAFMAPEQLRGDRVSGACDVFALGAVLAYAATGRPPFGDASGDPDALVRRISGSAPDLSGVPGGLLELVSDCLAKDPAARPATAEVPARAGCAGDLAAGQQGWLSAEVQDRLDRHTARLRDLEQPKVGLGKGGAVATTAAALSAVRRTRTQTGAPAPQLAPAVSRTPPAVPPPPRPAPEQAAPPAGRGHGPGPATGPGQWRPSLPTASAPVPVPSSALPPPPPVYGYAQAGYEPPPYEGEGPQSSYGYAQAGYGPPAPASVPGIGPAAPYVPAGTPGPPERNLRTTVALIAVAVLVAIGAGGSVYAFMDGDGTKDHRAARAADTADPKPPAGSSVPSPGGPSSPTPSPTPSEKASGVPATFLGSWSSGLDTSAGHSTRRLVLRQGTVGDTVLFLTADGPAGPSAYHCVFEAELAGPPGEGQVLRIGPSTVTVGRPRSSCTPGPPSELRLLGDGRLRRTSATGGSLTYTKAG